MKRGRSLASVSQARMNNDRMCKPHFQIYDGPSVITKRNFGLLRGKTIQEAPNKLVKAPPAKPNRRRSMDVCTSPPPTPDSGFWSPTSSSEHIGPVLEHRRSSMPCGISGPCDRSSNVWEWPLGEPKVVNGDEYFEAHFPIAPFSADEIWVTVMGNELTIHCRSDASMTGHREIFRCYMLPLNVNPRTAEFSVIRSRYLRILVRKVLPLKLAIGFYGADWDEGISEDGRSDSEMISSSDD